MTVPSDTVSVVICAYTRERWRELGDSIRSVLGQDPPVREVVVVVDHNPDLEVETRAAFPEAVVVPSTGQPGLSGARNTGIARAQGDILVFLDDDAEAEPDYVARMVRHLAVPAVGGVTAQVVPEWQGTRPRWFPDEFLWVVGCSHQGGEARRVRNLLGAGMCIRRDVFERVGGFDCEMGRTRGWLPMGGEETELCMRAGARISGLAFLYEPAAVVRHCVRAERLTWTYFMKRCLAEGLSKARLAALAPQVGRLDVERRYVLETLTRARVRDARAALVEGDFAALQRIMATVLGLACAGSGYAAARLAALLRRPWSRSAAPRERRLSGLGHSKGQAK